MTQEKSKTKGERRGSCAIGRGDHGKNNKRKDYGKEVGHFVGTLMLMMMVTTN